jgi:hypothetical protein
MKNTIQKMVNLWWNDIKVDEDGNADISPNEFKDSLEYQFPELQFTYSVQTNEWLLLTEC